MELEIDLSRCSNPGAAEVFCSWLKKLGSLQLGFDRLENFKISIVIGHHWPTVNYGPAHSVDGVLRNLMGNLERLITKIEFACKELQLEVLGHACSNACASSLGPYCASWKKLEKLFGATGTRPLNM